MSNCRVLYMLAIVAVLLRLSVTSAGPARSLGSVIASRTVKIPRAIRAPFRNNEMMTARGFGKRSQQMIKFKDGESSFSASLFCSHHFNNLGSMISILENFLKPDSEVPWPIDNIQDDTNPSDNTDSTQKILSTQFDER